MSGEPVMAFKIVLEEDFVRAELTARETVEETKDFLRALAGHSAAYARFLIHIRHSRPMFRLEQGGLIDVIKLIAPGTEHRIALVADTRDLQVSHEYFELIAQQHRVNLRSFRSVGEAVAWLRQPAAPPNAA